MSSQQPPTKRFAGLNEPRRIESISAVMERYNNIIKSPQDKKEYRGLVLSNRMKVLLVSDPDTNNSAAAMNVNVGYLNDPEELPGLAHFCEHMLFLGTEKYPEENYYDTSLSEYGGSANASTSSDHTTFYFNVMSDHLEEMLDVFAQFFKSPLFTESATNRELNAINSEHENNMSSDRARLDQVIRSTADPKHPYHKFDAGNRDTLETIPKAKGIDVRNELLNFHRKWYSSSIMALAVLGTETLDELEAMVVDMFSDVEDRSVSAPSWPDSPFPPALRRKKIYCQPVNDIRELSIEFTFPDVTKYYKSGPDDYIGHLLGHEGPGSLLSALKARSWCNSLSSGAEIAGRGFGFFKLEVDLTEDGLQHIDDIVSLVFQYINMLRTRGVQRWVWEEQRDLMAMDFRFKDARTPTSVVEVNAKRLQELPMEDILSASCLMSEWRPELIEELLSLLTPDNVRVTITAQYFSGKCTQTEPWFGTKYLLEDIEDTLIRKWRSVEPTPEFHLPPVNEFIPSNFELVTTEDSTTAEPGPVIIKDTPVLRLWFKRENKFMSPKAVIMIDLVSPVVCSDPVSCNLSAVWLLLLEESLQQRIYGAELAGLFWSIRETSRGLRIKIDGYHDKQEVLLEKIVDILTDFKTDPKTFEIMKENLIRDLTNSDSDRPSSQSKSLIDDCLAAVSWGTSQLLDSMKGVTVQQLDEFIPRVITNVHLECLIYGNVTGERALEIANILESRLLKNASPLHAQQLMLKRAVQLDKGSWHLCEKQNRVHKSSCACVYYECGVLGLRQSVVLELLVNVLREPCFNVLRTKEQLGYSVSSDVRTASGVQGLRVSVQHDRRHPVHVEARIEAFIGTFLGYLEGMGEEEFLKYRTALAGQLQKKPDNMIKIVSKMWSEIISQEYNFVRTKMELDQLNTITKDELTQFYKKYISASSAERRKLSAHVVSTAEGGAGREQHNTTSHPQEGRLNVPTKITNLVEFKSLKFLYPLPAPYITVPIKGVNCQL